MKQLGVLDKMVDALQKVLRTLNDLIPSIMGTLMYHRRGDDGGTDGGLAGRAPAFGNDHRAAINLLIAPGTLSSLPPFILVKEIANVLINRLILIQHPCIVAVWVPRLAAQV